MMRLVAAVLALAVCSGPTRAQWQVQSIATEANFRGLSVVDARAVWVSGTLGTFGRTVDGGATWTVGIVPGAEKLDFRAVRAFGESTAYLLSAGPGAESRIYKTTDAGRSWVLQFQCADPAGFFDALAFWDDSHGIALGDAVNGRFQLITTSDGGAYWTPLEPKTLPAAEQNEGAFAASGTCLIARGNADAWFVTGGAKASRVFRSTDRGQTWSATTTPIPAGVESAGIFSIAFRDGKLGMVVGGDYRKPQESAGNVAITRDGGATWSRTDKPLPYRSCVAWAQDRWVAVGISGSDVSRDDGATWQPLDQQNYNSVAFTPTGEGWAVGPKGRIARFVR